MEITPEDTSVDEALSFSQATNALLMGIDEHVAVAPNHDRVRMPGNSIV